MLVLGSLHLFSALLDGQVVRLLLEAGADPTLSTYGDEIRPLDVAIKGDKRDCVMYLQVISRWWNGGYGEPLLGDIHGVWWYMV